MFKNKKLHMFVASAFICSGVLASSEEMRTNGGDVMEPAEVNQWSITVYPDGENLPDGSGTAARGAIIYSQGCIACHGPNGDGGVGPRLVGLQGYPKGSKDPLKALSVGAWPNATSIFDYTRRAMPHHAPKTLSNSDVYSLTAYMLHLNGLLGEDDVLNRESLKRVEMPNKTSAINSWKDSEQGRD